MKKMIVLAFSLNNIRTEDLLTLKRQLEMEANVKVFTIPHYSTTAEPIYSVAIFTVRED